MCLNTRVNRPLHCSSVEAGGAQATDPAGAPVTATPWMSTGSWLGLLGTLALTVLLLAVPGELVRSLGGYGYVGVFVLTLMANATIVMPSPALAVALVAGASLNPWWVGVVGGTAAAIGETTGYVAGYSGSFVTARWRIYPRVAAWVDRWGGLTIFTLAVLPGPLIDIAGIAAGSVRYSFPRFLLLCWVGKIIRFIAMAWIGLALGQAGYL